MNTGRHGWHGDLRLVRRTWISGERSRGPRGLKLLRGLRVFLVRPHQFHLSLKARTP